MPMIQAEQWLADARNGISLETDHRRHVISYLTAVEELTIAQLAQLFNVHERTISNDRMAIRKLLAENIKEEDVSLILADIRLQFETNLRDIGRSKAKCKMGTRTYLDHCNAAFKMQMDYMRGFQDLGVFPKELGSVTVNKFEFQATVGLTADANPRPVKMFDKDIPELVGEIVTPKALTDGNPTVQTVPEPGSTTPVVVSGDQA